MKENEMNSVVEIEYLNKLYQCAEMGLVGIDTILDKTQNEEFLKALHSQRQEYDKIENKIVNVLKKYGCEEKKIGKMAKMSSEMMSDMRLKVDHTDSQIAKMMIEGNNKGIIEVTKIQNNYEGQDEELKEICTWFLDTLNHNIEQMKRYL